jgi:hypothetical protein
VAGVAPRGIGGIAPFELTQLPVPAPANDRTDRAVLALRRAELLSPLYLHRNPLARDVLVELLARSRRDSPMGRELREMTYRVGLPG